MNALFLQDAGLGDFTEHLTAENITSFLDRLDTFAENLRSYQPDYNALYRAWDTALDAISRSV